MGAADPCDLFHQGVLSLERVLSASGKALLPDVELSPAGHRVVEVGLRQIERLSAELRGQVPRLLDGQAIARARCRR